MGASTHQFVTDANSHNEAFVIQTPIPLFFSWTIISALSLSSLTDGTHADSNEWLVEVSLCPGTGWCPGCSHQFRWNISGCSRLSFPLQGVLWICLHFIWKSPFSPFLWNHWWMNISLISQRSGRCYSHPPERPGKYYHADLPRCLPCCLVYK